MSNILFLKRRKRMKNKIKSVSKLERKDVNTFPFDREEEHINM